MGMYDELRCEYPLPAPDAQNLVYQTKDTPSQYLDLYVIRADGTLWQEEYDTEDHSDPNATGLMALRGMATKVNTRLVPCAMTGEVRFYTFRDGGKTAGWIEFSAYFTDGKLQLINLIEDQPGLEGGGSE